MADDVQAVSVDQLKVAFGGPALASNRFFVTLGPGGMRLAFCEEYATGHPAEFRTAVILSVQDAISLKRVMTELLKDIEIKLAAALTNA